MTYQVIIEKKAQKEAAKIPVQYRGAVDKAITSLSSNPRPHNSKKLTEREGYRIRVGNYRILYTIDDKAKIAIIYRIKIKSKAIYK
ncbi:MAG: type II toxin-antitoxin system RelE/ParE family toxin [Nitrospirae bacterium]|nr:type II toxin-antitoxin system RelE/ParE family toxin [Nitrospirota bacterium]